MVVEGGGVVFALPSFLLLSLAPVLRRRPAPARGPRRERRVSGARTTALVPHKLPQQQKQASRQA